MIKIKKKICNECKKETYIFSKGRCRECANNEYRETAIKNKRAKEGPERKDFNNKRNKIKPRSKKGQKTAKEDTEFFKGIWLSRPHYSEVSGVFLGNEYNPVFMSHVLTKGAYPKARHWKENIVLMTFEEHNLYEFGDRSTKEFKNMFKKVMLKYSELINRYYLK